MKKLSTVVVLLQAISDVGVSHPRLTPVVQLRRIHPMPVSLPHYQFLLPVPVNLHLRSLIPHTRLSSLLRKSPLVLLHHLSNNTLRYRPHHPRHTLEIHTIILVNKPTTKLHSNMTCTLDTLCLQVGIRIQEWVPLPEDLVNHLAVWPLPPPNMDTGHSPNNKSSKGGIMVGDKLIALENFTTYAPLFCRYALLTV